LRNEMLSQPMECSKSGGIGGHSLELLEGGEDLARLDIKRLERGQSGRELSGCTLGEGDQGVPFQRPQHHEMHERVGSLGMWKSLGLTRNPDISVSVAPAVLAKVSNTSHISGGSPESEMSLASREVYKKMGAELGLRVSEPQNGGWPYLRIS
jgi:hypothetical protein